MITYTRSKIRRFGKVAISIFFYVKHVWIYQKHTYYASGKTVVYMNLYQSEGRYLYNLAMLFHKAGYQIFLRHRFSFVARLGQYSTWLLELPERKLYYSDPKDYDLLVTGNNDVSTDDIPTIVVDYNYFALQDSPNVLPVSFMMPPGSYRNSNIYGKMTTYQMQKRCMRVLFVGNSNPGAYQEGQYYITQLFRKNFRPALISYIKQHLNANEQTQQHPNEPSTTRKIFFLPRISGDQWLNVLSQSDFFCLRVACTYLSAIALLKLWQ